LISYTSDEFKSILANSSNAGMSPTEFVRNASLRKHIKPMDPSEKYRLEYKAEVRRIGNNLNQIAKYINQKYVVHDLEYVGKSLVEIDRDLKSLIRLLS